MLPLLPLVAFALAQTPPQESLGPAKALKVLYAGAPGAERTAHFMEFLKPWFAQVDSVGLAQLNSRSAAAYDVVIADWKRQYKDGNPEDFDAPAVLNAAFTKPVIMLGAVAGTIQRHSKIDWL